MDKSKLLELCKKEGLEYALGLMADDLHETSTKTRDFLAYLMNAIADLREEIIKLQGCRAICQQLNLLVDVKGTNVTGPQSNGKNRETLPNWIG